MVKLSSFFNNFFQWIVFISILFFCHLVEVSAQQTVGVVKTSQQLENEYQIPTATDSRYSGGVVYIDPDYSGTEMGTIEKPFNSFGDVTFKDNTAFVVKRGTNITMNSNITIGNSNILLGAYGTGAPPIIKFSENKDSYWKFLDDNVVVRDLSFYQHLRFGDYGKPVRDQIVFNCLLDGAEYCGMGIVSWGGYCKIIGNTIRNYALDGIFVEAVNGSDDLEIGYNSITNCNTNWEAGKTQSEASGDGIQIDGIKTNWIHHNVVDRSSTGHKFCIIIQDKKENLPGGFSATLENNIIYAPFKDNTGANGVYIQGNSDGSGFDAIIRRNKFFYTVDSDCAIVLRNNNAGTTTIYSNVFVGFTEAINGVGNVKELKCYNNTSYDVSKLIDKMPVLYENNLNVSKDEASNYFQNAGANDYRLKSISSAVDAGKDVGLKYDILNTPIPQNGTPDLGAYEYTTNTNTQEPITNSKPIAQAGKDVEVIEGTNVVLDGSGSYDAEKQQLTFKWTGPANIDLKNASTVKPSFIAPAVVSNTAYEFSLIVNDGELSSSADKVIVTVKPEPIVTINTAPKANAGEDKIVNQADNVLLDGSKSFDPDGDQITYTWNGPTGIELSNSDKAKASFVAPELTEIKKLVFSLRVSDGELTSLESTVEITINPTKQAQVNSAPQAISGDDRIVYGGQLIELDGSNSVDPDNDKISYSWANNENINLSAENIVNPLFVAPDVDVETNYFFSLQVNDGYLNSARDEIKITVLPYTYKENAEKLAINNVIASTHDGNLPANSIDNSLYTRWSAEGSGQWIYYELSGFDSVKFVKTAWHKGIQRKALFDIQVSEDGSQWETIQSNALSSGLTDGFQVYDFANQKARFLRIVGLCNDNNEWNSITEVEIFGIPESQENNSTSIESIFIDKMRVYPNPSQGMFTVDFKDQQVNSGKILILNTIGQLISEINITGFRSSFAVDLSQYPNGIYMVHYYDANQVIATKKILIE